MSVIASTTNAAPPNVAHVATKEERAEKAERDAKKAGGEFEAILVRQMLTSARVGGTSGYADMAVEAVAGAVTAGGGLGLGRQIADAIAHVHGSQDPHIGGNAPRVPRAQKSSQGPR